MAHWTQFVVALMACMGALVCGTMLAFTAPVVPWLESKNSSAPFHATTAETSWIASLFPVGGFFGALPAGFIMNLLGKKKTIVAFSIPWILCYVAVVIATNVYYLYVSRFVMGLVTGVLSTCIPTYIGEIAEAPIRGLLGSFFQIYITIGICVIWVLGITESYKILGIICAAIAAIFSCCSVFLPESPLNLLKAGKEDKAVNVLKFLRGMDYDEKTELAEMKKSLEASSGGNRTFKELATKANVKAIIIGVGLQFGQQLSGVNAVIFYTSTIFETAGASLSPNTSSIILGVVQVLATCVSASLTDKTGRKALLISSSAVMGICLAALGGVFYVKEHGTKITGFLGYIPVISLMVFIIMFSIGFGPVPWVMIGELFSPEIKGIGSSMAVATNWILAFIVTKTYPLVSRAIGNSITFWIFAGICFVVTIWIIFGVVETKGKTLQQIQEELAK